MPWSSNACGKRLVQRMKALDGTKRAGGPVGSVRLEKVPDVATKKPPLQTACCLLSQRSERAIRTRLQILGVGDWGECYQMS